jgi:hypothetical protein
MPPYPDPQPEPSLPAAWLAEQEAAVARVAGWLVRGAEDGSIDPAVGEQEARAAEQRATLTLERLREPGARRRVARLRSALSETVRYFAAVVAAEARARKMRALGFRRVRRAPRARGAGPRPAPRRIARRATCRDPDPDDPAAGHPHVPLSGPAPWHWRRLGWRS